MAKYIHVKTKDEYDQLMRIFEDKGWTWISGTKPTKNNLFDTYYSDTVIKYDDKFTYGGIQYAFDDRYEIISFKEFKDIERKIKYPGLSIEYEPPLDSAGDAILYGTGPVENILNVNYKLFYDIINRHQKQIDKMIIKSKRGEQTMELDTIKKENLKEAKKQADEERMNAEIAFAKREYIQLIDIKNDLDIQMNELKELLKETNDKLNKFKVR